VASAIWRLKVGPIGVNCYIAESNGSTVIIDPGAEPEKIHAFLNAHSMKPSMVVLTHGHLDHSAAIADLFELLGTELPIAIHPDDAQYLGADGQETNRVLFEAIKAPSYFHSFWKPLPPATVFLSDETEVPGTTLHVIHTPGHSKGSICLYEASLDAGSYGTDEDERRGAASWSCIISGDTLFRDGVGRTDAPDSDAVALERSLRRLAQYSYMTLVFPGHGPRTTIGRELSAPFHE